MKVLISMQIVVMTTPKGRDVLIDCIYHRKKGETYKKRVVKVFCGVSMWPARILIFEDHKRSGKSVSKSKHSIILDGAKIQNVFSSTIAVSSGEMHEFKFEGESERSHWVLVLGLLVSYPYSPIPEEPTTNLISLSFCRNLEAGHYGVESAWPVYILPGEVGFKLGIIGVHVLTLHHSQLNIFNPSCLWTPVVTWDRNEIQRYGKIGSLVFLEIERWCKGGPGLLWIYTAYEFDELNEALHWFLIDEDLIVSQACVAHAEGGMYSV